MLTVLALGLGLVVGVILALTGAGILAVRPARPDLCAPRIWKLRSTRLAFSCTPT